MTRASLIHIEDSPGATPGQDDDADEHFSDKSGKINKSPEKDWMEFYEKTDDINETQLAKFLGLKMLDASNFSAKFLDFVKECLVFDPKDRMKAFDLLSHPVFRKYSRVY